MKQRRKYIFMVWALLLGGLGALRAADEANHAVSYRWESEPRAVLSHEIQSSMDPKLGVRASGAVYLLAVYDGGYGPQLGLAISHDGGDEFAPPVPISQKGAPVSSHGENSPSLAFGMTEIYALWEQHRPEGGTDLMFARSINFGRSFEKPIRVTDKTQPSFNGFSHLAVAPDGSIYAVWLDERDREAGPPGTSAVYLAKSTNRGATFGKNVRVATGACPCCRPTLAVGNHGEVFASWRKVFDGQIRDMVVSTSSDKGESFAAPVRVAEDRWKIHGCPHSGMTLVAKGNRLYVSWFSEGSKGNAGVRVSWSDDSGKTFAPPRIISGPILDANHPALALTEDERILLVFQGRDPMQKDGWGPARAHLVEIRDTGEISAPLPVLGNRKGISYPVAAGGDAGRVFVAWTEPGEKGKHIRLLRGRRTR